MRGSTLVNAIREDMAKYPNVCRMILYLYDEDEQEHIGEDAEYVEDLFIKNPDEKARFIEALDNLEKDVPVFLVAKITEAHVILFYKTPKAKIFSRRKPLNPLDIT